MHFMCQYYSYLFYVTWDHTICLYSTIWLWLRPFFSLTKCTEFIYLKDNNTVTHDIQLNNLVTSNKFTKIASISGKLGTPWRKEKRQTKEELAQYNNEPMEKRVWILNLTSVWKILMEMGNQMSSWEITHTHI